MQVRISFDGGISMPKNEILRASFFALARFDQSTALRMI